MIKKGKRSRKSDSYEWLKHDILERIKTEPYNSDIEEYLVQLPGNQVTLQYIQEHCFDKPILIVDPSGLDIRIPSNNFMVRDVRNLVGPQRVIDVMDVRTQSNLQMTLEDWCAYYESKQRDKLLNVISLEFSHTLLDDYVMAPKLVRELDWVDKVWPRFLKQTQTESTNSLPHMKYPKVQKYCLMSVKGSFTDFHIDFGGTSVWYHIIRGKKIFWMVPPTELNFETFVEWTKSGLQQKVFFGDTVAPCFKVCLEAGNTFLIPSGWIHAVYTPEDSLVFGGNFLHSYSIQNQLRVSRVEDETKVPAKFRYPFYKEIQWYALNHYLYNLTGKNHIDMIEFYRYETSISTMNSMPPTSTPLTATNTTTSTTPTDSTSQATSITESDDETDIIDFDEPELSQGHDINANDPLLSLAHKHEYSTDKLKEVSLDNLSDSIEHHIQPKRSKTDDSPPGSAPSDRMSTEQSLSGKFPSTSTNDQVALDLSIHATNHNTQTQTGQPQDVESNLKMIDTNLYDDQDQTASLIRDLLDEIVGAVANEVDHDARSEYHSMLLMNRISGQDLQKSPRCLQPQLEMPIRCEVHWREFEGFKLLVEHLGKRRRRGQSFPFLIRDAEALLVDCRKVIFEREQMIRRGMETTTSI